MDKKIIYYQDTVIQICPSKEIGFDWKVDDLSGSAFTQEEAEREAKAQLSTRKK